MRPENTLDWIAFVLLVVDAFAWGYFVTDVKIMDVTLERIRGDPLDDVLFVGIAAAGAYWVVRVLRGARGVE